MIIYSFFPSTAILNIYDYLRTQWRNQFAALQFSNAIFWPTIMSQLRWSLHVYLVCQIVTMNDSIMLFLSPIGMIRQHVVAVLDHPLLIKCDTKTPHVIAHLFFSVAKWWKFQESRALYRKRSRATLYTCCIRKTCCNIKIEESCRDLTEKKVGAQFWLAQKIWLITAFLGKLPALRNGWFVIVF